MSTPKSITLLHTSDWHLGRRLYGRKRTEEHAAFLDWLVEEIQRRAVDVLLLAGDVFDNTTPNHQALRQYYQFLSRVSQSCHHVVVISGNHDSPSLLNAPKDMLEALNIHVVAQVSENLEDEVLVLALDDAAPGLIVCAVPYLRDRDIRASRPEESIEDKARNLVEGIRDHYRAVCRIAEAKRRELGGRIPIVGMGHLFARGGITQEGVRELYVGSLAHVDLDTLPDSMDYLALGHLHVCQRVDRQPHLRYSGAPLPIGFGEAGQPKFVLEVTLSADSVEVNKVPIPCFQELHQLRGDLAGLAAQIEALKEQKKSAWLEVVYEGTDVVGDLQAELQGLVGDSELEILRIKNTRVTQAVVARMEDSESLDDLTVEDVFSRYLETACAETSSQQRDMLMHSFREVVASLSEEDPLAD